MKNLHAKKMQKLLLNNLKKKFKYHAIATKIEQMRKHLKKGRPKEGKKGE